MVVILSAFFIAFAVSLICGLAFVLFSKRIFSIVRRDDLGARQASHLRPALRLGGIGLVGGLWVAAFVFDSNSKFLTLLVGALPILVSGLLEDAGRWQSPKMRLSMAVVSGGIVIAITGIHLDHVGIAGVDQLFVYFPVAVAFTLFATVGIVHGINLVDGLNGFAGAVSLVATAGLTAVAHLAGANTMDLAAPAIIGAVLGFLALNFPGGRIFLGDAGAYSLGFVLAWSSVFLMDEVPTLSPWAVVMLFFWPVTDTFVAMWRRQWTGLSMGQPDRMHFHQVVMRSLEIILLKRKNRRISNPLTTLVVTPLMMPPAMAGIYFWNDDVGSATAFFVFGLLFVAAYLLLIRQARRGRMPLGGRGTVSSTVRRCTFVGRQTEAEAN